MFVDFVAAPGYEDKMEWPSTTVTAINLCGSSDQRSAPHVVSHFVTHFSPRRAHGLGLERLPQTFYESLRLEDPRGADLTP